MTATPVVDESLYFLIDGSRAATGNFSTFSLLPVTHDTYNIGADGNAYKKIFLAAGTTSVTARVGVKGFHQYAATSDVFVGLDNVFPTYYVQKSTVNNSLVTDNTEDHTNLYQGDVNDKIIYTCYQAGTGTITGNIYGNLQIANGALFHGYYDATNSLGGGGIVIGAKASITGTYLTHDITNTRFNLRCSSTAPGMGGTILTSIGLGGTGVVDIVPIDSTGGLRNNAIDLGIVTTGEWKDLFLAGTANIGGDLVHTGTNVGVYGVTAAARPAAYTQTYTTATRIHSNPTASTLTDNTGGTANNVLAAIAGDLDATMVPINGSGMTTAQESEYDTMVAAMNTKLGVIADNFADVADEVNKLIADVANTKQVLNQAIDDDQIQGFKQ